MAILGYIILIIVIGVLLSDLIHILLIGLGAVAVGSFILGCIRLIGEVYAIRYFESEQFERLKSFVVAYVNDCNDLNKHIDELGGSFLGIQSTYFGQKPCKTNRAGQTRYIGAEYNPFVYDCSKYVLQNASNKPYPYLCKYFNINEDMQTIDQLEETLNRYMAAEEGKKLLKRKRDSIIEQIFDSIPWAIKVFFSKRFDSELGFDEYDFNEIQYPVYSFRCTSLRGDRPDNYSIKMDISGIQNLMNYISDRLQYRNSAKVQRRLMTPTLRRAILMRDNNTCRRCGNSTQKEPNLLLEVDHIIPVSKGGKTETENLQTLCWRCNRSKGAKLIE